MGFIRKLLVIYMNIKREKARWHNYFCGIKKGLMEVNGQSITESPLIKKSQKIKDDRLSMPPYGTWLKFHCQL